jgi:ankyrin repeat protein
MTGNHQVRFCEHCELQVRNISAMTRQEAMRLVARSGGRLCLRVVQRPDGAPLTGQVPEKLHRIGRRISRLAAGAFSATLGLSAAAAQTRTASNPPPLPEIASIAKTVSPGKTRTTISGMVIDPNGARVAGATLSLSNPLTQLAYTFTTGDDGAYIFTMLEPGNYNLVAEAPTFARTEKSGVLVRPNVTTNIDLTMDLPLLINEVEIQGTTTEEITVNGGVAFAEPTEPLVKAAYKNDLQAVAELALASSDVNVSDRLTHTTALAHAVENANRDMVQVLLSAGANVNSRNNYGVTPLMHLGTNASVELLRDLLAAGADIYAADESGMTALLKVAGSSNFEVVNELINAGARIDVKDNEGTTALMNAAGNEDARVVKFLVGAGLDVAAKDQNGGTALMIATRWGGTEAVRALIEKGNINAADNEGATALMSAASQADPEITRMLINKGANVNLKDDDGRTALMLAVADNKTGNVLLLLAAGADINAQDEEGQTALMRADEAETVMILLNARADMSIKDNKGRTALARALKEDQEEVAKLLRSRGAPE